MAKVKEVPRAVLAGGTFRDLLLSYSKQRKEVDPQYKRDVHKSMLTKWNAAAKRQIAGQIQALQGTRNAPTQS